MRSTAWPLWAALAWLPLAVAAQEVDTNRLGMRLVKVPAGEFWMGSADSAEALARDFPQLEARRFALLGDERPRHRVRISRAFWLGQHEVTVGQWRRFLAESGHVPESIADGTGGYGWRADYDPATTRRGDAFEGRSPRYSWAQPGFPQGEDHPVTNVSWNDAQALADWLTRVEGRRYRLPTEAEWEYACRAGSQTRYPGGDQPEALRGQANVFAAETAALWPQWRAQALPGEDGHVFTAPVGRYAANAFGLHDMLGNVWEWVQDWHDDDSYARHAAAAGPDGVTVDPQGPPEGGVRVRRGGSWHSWPFYARCGYRNWNDPSTRYVLVGIRLLREDAVPRVSELRQLLQQQRFAQARPGLQVLLAQTYPDAATRLLIQDWLVAVDDLAELERRVQARLARQPEAVDHLGAGRLALERKQFDAARRHFQQAHKLAPDADTRARAERGLAGVAYQQRDYALSLRHLEAARDLAPSDAERPDLLMALNETLIRLGRTNDAVAAAEEAVRLNPEHEQANYQLGNGYTRVNYSELAQRCGAEFAQAATLTRRASDAFEQQALDQAREAAHAALAACPGYGRAHAVLAKVGEAQRLAVDIHREADERRFAATPMPEIPGIERYVINWSQLSPRHRKRVALSIAPWKAYVPVLVAGGATHYIKPLYMRLSETPGAKALRDARIDYDSRLWDDVRGMGGHMTVTGIEDVERSIFQRYNTVLHELSHQVHGVLPAAQQREIQDLYQQAKARDAQSGQAFMSRYAGGSIWEYFAEGANGQDSPRRDAHDFREIVRERLVEKDPALQALVLRLFAQRDVSASLPLALVNGAHQHLEAGELPPALAQLTRAARLAPQDEQVLIAQLYALSLQGQPQPVEAAARRALARRPDSGSLRAAVVSARWHAGQALAPQLAGLAQGRERLGARDRFEVYMALGRYRLILGQSEAALSDFDHALAYQGDSPEALWGRASALAQAQRWDEAFDVYGRVLQLRTGLMALRLDYARQLLIAGRLEQAQAQLNETRTLNPTEPELLALQAWLALAQQQPSQALTLSAQALQAAPWCDTARLVQAAAWRQQGDEAQRQRAQAQLDELQARLRPGSTPRQVYRADVSSWTSVNVASADWERSRAAVLALR